MKRLSLAAVVAATTLPLWAQTIEGNWIRYRVVRNDSLSEIIQKEIVAGEPDPKPRIYGERGLLKKALEINPSLKNPDLVVVGQEIYLPWNATQATAPVPGAPVVEKAEPEVAVVSSLHGWARTGAEIFSSYESTSAAVTDVKNLRLLPMIEAGLDYKPNVENRLEWRLGFGFARLLQQNQLKSSPTFDVKLRARGRHWAAQTFWEQRTVPSSDIEVFEANGDTAYVSRRASVFGIGLGPSILLNDSRSWRLEALAEGLMAPTSKASAKLAEIPSTKGWGARLGVSYDGLLASRALVLEAYARRLAPLSDDAGWRIAGYGGALEWKF
jgi:hypothetical protein